MHDAWRPLVAIVGGEPGDDLVPVALERQAEPERMVGRAAEAGLTGTEQVAVERVIGHLLQNAVDASTASGIIRVRAGMVEGQALIEVEDNGQGMSGEFVRTRLFRPFSSTKAHGMGIGTFESREYVRELGGSLEVDSREGSGTTFRIRLPLVADPALSEPEVAGV